MSKVDLAGLRDPEIGALKKVEPPAGMPFKIGKMGHAVLVVRDIDASVKNASCRLLKKIQRRGARKIDERRRTSAVR